MIVSVAVAAEARTKGGDDGVSHGEKVRDGDGMAAGSGDDIDDIVV